MIWLHIIADFNQVDFDKIELNEKILRDFLLKQIKENSLTSLWDYFHTFSNSNEITGVIALAESHLSIHTWPEKEYISLDIFVCNFWEENSIKAKNLYKSIVKFFNPWKIEEKLITRKWRIS